MSTASKDDGTRYMQKSSARPTSAGTDPGTMWRSPTARSLFPQVRRVPPSPWWTLVVDALRGRISVEPPKTETGWLGAASSRKILVQVQRGFAGLGPRRLANSIFHMVGCRQCQAPADCKSSEFESTLGEHRSMSPYTMWRGQASTQGRYTQLRVTISTRARTGTGTKQVGPSEIDAYLLWISGHTLWDEGPFSSVQQCFLR